MSTLYGGGLSGGGASALMSHACSFASITSNPPISMKFSKNKRASSNAGGSTSTSTSSEASEYVGSYLSQCAVFLRFVTPFVLVAIGAGCFDGALFALLRLSLAQEYSIQGGVHTTVMRYAHMALVFSLSASSAPAATTLLLFALPLSCARFLASSFAGKLAGALLHAASAWMLWVRAPESALSKWVQRDAPTSGAGGEGGEFVWRILHAALSPSFSGSLLLQRLTQIEGLCQHGDKGIMGMPAWAGEMQQFVTSVITGYVALAVVILLVALALCRLASSHMAARTICGARGRWEGGLMRHVPGRDVVD